MKKLSMKHLTALVLVLALLCTLCPACEQSGPAPGPKEPEKLRVLIDQPYASLEADLPDHEDGTCGGLSSAF